MIGIELRIVRAGVVGNSTNQTIDNSGPTRQVASLSFVEELHGVRLDKIP